MSLSKVNSQKLSRFDVDNNMASVFRKAGDTFRSKPQNTSKQEEGASLTTVLETVEDRQAFTLLVCDITERMRTRLLDTFNPNEGDQRSEAYEQGAGADTDEQAQKQEALERQRSELANQKDEVRKEATVELKNAALNFFDDWRDSVILRVGEAVNARKEAEEQSHHPKPGTSTSDDKPSSAGLKTDEQDAKVDEVLKEIYTPIKTPLRDLDESRRALILHSLLLLMLSLEHYNAYSRILLLYCLTSLGLSITILAKDETQVAQGLLAAAKHMSADEETKKRAADNSMARKWKMGTAGVAGAALIGITGGLAAPFLAAGIGTVLGGIGLGATATAGLLGSLAGSSVLVGGLFGAYGARMSTQAMEKYTRDVEDFAFIPIHESSKDDASLHRLRVGIGISGWLGDTDDIVLPWTVLGDGLETFALRFEVEALESLGNSLRTLITSLAWKFAKTEIIKRTVFAALMAGLWPMSLTNAGRIIDNPWSVASQRAQKAGEVLADALINKAQGERPVTLLGYSLGARVIYVCLQELARRRAFGLVENAVLLGAPTPSSSSEWRAIRTVVTGRVINGFSTKDYILAFLYRTSSIQFGVAGLQPMLAVKGIENVDVSDLVEGHTLYRHAAGPILGRLGFENVDIKELTREERRLKEQEKEERQKREEAGSMYQSGNDEKAILDATNDEIEKMEKEREVKQATHERQNASGASEKQSLK
ncbi:hypothetical protein F5B22DRAFT_585669 [Xylaria bambusicola]|uniref:uncharacterized protein n=1 Tax=Xylaria bambusicola TaxID=326684 RepID=UPI00200851DC|nr:uncharacterized protein F5B22DRAFT_585669 [Xylaria bambusicola]KAI0526415.1 hypothetical protein F5B22DRAFT_585669 [Xylaria bambusicola]